MALPKKNRLNRRELSLFFKSPHKRFVTPLFLVNVQENDLGFLRAATSISKKKFSKAVLRSKIKRLISQAILKITQDGFEYSYDLVFIPTKDLTRISFVEINSQVKQFFLELKEKG